MFCLPSRQEMIQPGRHLLPPHDSYTDLFTLRGVPYLFCHTGVSIPVVWKAEFAWTGGPSPVRMGRRCNGARTASPAGSGPTPWADSPVASSCRCCPHWTTDPVGRPRCPRRLSRSPTASSDLHERTEAREGRGKKIEGMRKEDREEYVSPHCQTPCRRAVRRSAAAVRQSASCLGEAADVSEASCQV